jgi:hypothetical protein
MIRKVSLLPILLCTMLYASAQTDYLTKAKDAFRNKHCKAADTYYLAYRNTLSKRTPDDPVRERITSCLNSAATIAEAISADDAAKSLKPFPNSKKADNVRLGNESFKNGNYADAAEYYLQYMLANQGFFYDENNGDIEDAFLDKINYCLKM